MTLILKANLSCGEAFIQKRTAKKICQVGMFLFQSISIILVIDQFRYPKGSWRSFIRRKVTSLGQMNDTGGNLLSGLRAQAGRKTSWSDNRN